MSRSVIEALFQYTGAANADANLPGGNYGPLGSCTCEIMDWCEIMDRKIMDLGIRGLLKSWTCEDS